MLKNLVLHVAAIAVAMAFGALGQAYAADTKPIDVPAGELTLALETLAKQSGVEFVYEVQQLRGLQTKGVHGEFTTEHAVAKLLEGTKLQVTKHQSGAVLIATPQATSSVATAEPIALRLAQTDNTQSTNNQKSENSSPESSSEDSGTKLQEIVVTAQKREERLIDVPQAVTVLSSEYLAKLGATQFRDFANSVPGLSFTTAGAGYTQISLRGVTTGRDIVPTVGIYVDETPYGSSSAFANGSQLALDVGLFDMDRIEVLSGPQGTLYGASTMGGLIKYVTRRPDATRFGIDAQTGLANTAEGGVSYNGSIAVNAPIVADKAALRASGFFSHDGGYIANLALGEEDISRADIYGGRLDALFTPTDALSVRIVGFMQNIARQGDASAGYSFAGSPVDGRLDQRRLIEEPFDQRFRLVSSTITYDFGMAALSSVSSYQETKATQVFDFSALYVPFLNAPIPFGLGRSYSAVGFANSNDTDKFTQELRLASQGTEGIEWLIGAFYTRETSSNGQVFLPRDLAGQSAPNDLFTFSVPSTNEEKAVFGDLTYKLTEKLDVTGGVRAAQNRQKFEQIGSGVFGFSTPNSHSKDDVVTYLANMRYRLNDRATAYLRYATGYRPGGPNFAIVDTTGQPLVPETFEADRLKSYEVGFRGETRDRRFGIDAAAYDIDWSNIQITAFRGGFGVIANAEGATIRGAELTLTARPTRVVTVAGTFAYQDAQMSEADFDLGAANGERLPNVPRFTASLNADYELPVSSLQPTIGVTARYVGDRTSGFDNAVGNPSLQPQYRLPDYTTIDLRAGLLLGAVNAQLYVHNLLDERGQLAARIFGGANVAIQQPRTIGFNATLRF